MSLSYLGSLTFGQAVPLLGSTLAQALASIVQQVTALQSDLAALEADVASLTTDQAAVLADLADPTGLVESIQKALLAGPQAYVQGVQSAIAGIASGLTIASLQASLVAGPAIFIQSLQSSIASITARIAEIQARATAFAARIAGIMARAEALAARIAGLASLKVSFESLQALLAQGGLHAYAYGGPVSNLGSEISSSTSSGLPGGTGSDVASGILFVATSGGAIATLAEIFRGT